VRAEASGVHNALRDARVVEMEELLPEVEIFQQGRTTLPRLQGILVVAYRPTLLRRQHGSIAASGLMDFAAIASKRPCVGHPGRDQVVRRENQQAYDTSAGSEHALRY
jgi:hypothetical protein